MKKVFTMLVLMLVPFAMQAQKFHDVEANQAIGPVKSITTSMMGQDQVVTFTQDGKENGLNKAVYDENGYLVSAERSAMGMDITVKYTWENGKVKSQTMNVMGQDNTTTFVYNDKGELIKQTMNFNGQPMEIVHSDYKYDDRGNWISRKTSVMGQTNDSPRKIQYYE